MDYNLHLLYEQLVLPQKPIDSLSYMGEYEKRILHIYHCNEESFLTVEWPMLWRMMLAINNKITPLKYSDMATLNLKSNGHKTLPEILESMKPAICIVWGEDHLEEDKGVEKYQIITKGNMQLVYTHKLEAYEDSAAKKTIWGMFNQLFKKG